MKNEPTKLPMRKLIDFINEHTNNNPINTMKIIVELAEELEVEELALLGDAHYDGMNEMREILEAQDLLKNNNEYIKEKFFKVLPDVDGEQLIPNKFQKAIDEVAAITMEVHNEIRDAQLKNK